MTVTLSAYTQRPNPATGGVQDDYVYSVRVHRDAWSRIHFEKLEYFNSSTIAARPSCDDWIGNLR